MQGSSLLHERLSSLERRGSEALAPLWIDALSPEEALAAARGREGPIFRLQEADALLMLGRGADAASVLAGLGELPPGLSALRERLAERVPAPGAPAPVSGAAGPEAELKRWLERVRGWRGGGRV